MPSTPRSNPQGADRAGEEERETGGMGEEERKFVNALANAITRDDVYIAGGGWGVGEV